jgi:hypothetical protein
MIASLDPEEAEKNIDQLAGLLIDAVESGASVGFLPPLGTEEALGYWREVIAAMRQGRRVVLAAPKAILAMLFRVPCNSILKRAPTGITAPKP